MFVHAASVARGEAEDNGSAIGRGDGSLINQVDHPNNCSKVRAYRPKVNMVCTQAAHYVPCKSYVSSAPGGLPRKCQHDPISIVVTEVQEKGRNTGSH